MAVEILSELIGILGKNEAIQKAYMPGYDLRWCGHLSCGVIIISAWTLFLCFSQ